MPLASGLLRKVMTAEATREWLNAQVRGQVMSLGRPVSEGSVAVVTGIWPFAGMATDVDLEIEFGLKGSIAHVTFIRPLTRMHTNMSPGMVLLSRCIWAIWTSV